MRNLKLIKRSIQFNPLSRHIFRETIYPLKYNESSYDEELINDCSSAFIHAIAWRDTDTIAKILFKFFDFDNNDTALSFEDFLKKHGFQIIEGSHPGEGSEENHYFIARVGEVYYKVEYNYYSYQGLEFSKNDMIIVYPQQVMTTIFL